MEPFYIRDDENVYNQSNSSSPLETLFKLSFQVQNVKIFWLGFGWRVLWLVFWFDG